MIFLGTIVNTITVLIGSFIGLFLKGKHIERIGERIFQFFALLTIMIGVNGSTDLSQIYLIIGSIVIGTIIGELLQIDHGIHVLANRVQRRFTKGGDTSFAEGWIQTSLLFCLGSMTIVGSFEAGIHDVHTILITKAILDGVASTLFSSKYGIGVMMTAVTVFIYQGLLVLMAYYIGPFLTVETIAVVSTIGSMLLIGVGLNMLDLTKLKLANFLPAVFMPIVFQVVMMLIK